MKICRDCSNVCEGNAGSCLRCGSVNLAVVEEKICAYCKARIAVGTIICPHCHRVLPPEIQMSQVPIVQETQAQTIVAPLKSVEMFISGDIEDTIEENAEVDSAVKATTYQENLESVQEEPQDAVDLEEYQKQNPLFVMYDNTPDILPLKEEANEEAIKEPEEAAQEESQAEVQQSAQEELVPMGIFQEDPNSETFATFTAQIPEDEFEKGGIVETRAFNTGIIVEKESKKPQNRIVLYGMFAFMCLYTILGLCLTYMTHEFGNVIGYQMSAAVFVSFRDIFPSTYPYILYGSGLLAQYTMLGSHLPFFMNFAMGFAIVGGICTMISIIPKWVCATFNALAIVGHIAGIWIMSYLFGFRSVGIAAYILALGALAVFVVHVVFLGDKE